MKKLLIFIMLVAVCPWILISCQQTEVKKDKLQPKDQKVTELDEMHKDIKLNIHVRHFSEEKDEKGVAKQGVSPWVYSELLKEEQEKFTLRKDFRRHHEFQHIKEGICDNTVKTIDKDTGKIIYRCGGHTSTQR